MKVYLGKYPNNWWNTGGIYNWWLSKRHGKPYYDVNENELTSSDKFVENILDKWDSYVNYPINKLFVSKRKRRIEVRIDPEDTWSMDNTLAYIILPMLKQLKATKHGSPYIDKEDIPKELRFTKREQLVFDHGYYDKKLKATDEEMEAASKKFHDQWTYVIDQMIWSFEQEIDEDEGYKEYYDPYLPDEPIERRTFSVFNEDGTTTEKELPIKDEEAVRARGKFNHDKYKAYQERKQKGFTLFGKYYQALWD